MSTLLSAGQLPPHRHDDLENYGLDDFDDPFATPSPPSSPKKRKEPSSQGLGIDEEVSVQRRARVPRVKLDDERLLGPSGLPKLRQRARDLKIKGKGHEFSDTARLLSFYQMWLDDLFPKAKFLDALAMVEKAGHKKRVVVARNEILNEGKPKPRDPEEDAHPDLGRDLDAPALRTGGGDGRAPSTGDRPDGDRPATPARDSGVPDEEDLYDATPRNRTTRPPQPQADDIPGDEDDLDALIAEAESGDLAAPAVTTQSAAQARPIDMAEEDDLDALIAEAETRESNGKSPTSAQGHNGGEKGDDFAEEEAAMQDMDGIW
ncbi:hypothetical protein E4U54_002930 [Claviceps lovelessii]|nr:hypothetical protein E4U54_002930 [Claviceps lovelessii]